MCHFCSARPFECLNRQEKGREKIINSRGEVSSGFISLCLIVDSSGFVSCGYVFSNFCPDKIWGGYQESYNKRRKKRIKINYSIKVCLLFVRMKRLMSTKLEGFIHDRCTRRGNLMEGCRL